MKACGSMHRPQLEIGGMATQLTCVECGAFTKRVYREYSKGNISLVRCGDAQKECHSVTDKYVEFDSMLIFIDMMLLRPSVFRHLIFNRLPRRTGSVNAIIQLSLLLLLASVYTRQFLFVQHLREEAPRALRLFTPAGIGETRFQLSPTSDVEEPSGGMESDASSRLHLSLERSSRCPAWSWNTLIHGDDVPPSGGRAQRKALSGHKPSRGHRSRHHYRHRHRHHRRYPRHPVQSPEGLQESPPVASAADTSPSEDEDLPLSSAWARKHFTDEHASMTEDYLRAMVSTPNFWNDLLLFAGTSVVEALVFVGAVALAAVQMGVAQLAPPNTVCVAQTWWAWGARETGEQRARHLLQQYASLSSSPSKRRSRHGRLRSESLSDLVTEPGTVSVVGAIALALLVSSFMRGAVFLTLIWQYPVVFFNVVSLVALAGNVVSLYVSLRCSAMEACGAVAAGIVGVLLLRLVWVVTDLSFAFLLI